jgi:glyoxalase superfamily protein
LALHPDTLTFDCADPVRVAAFWAAALGFELETDPEPDVISVIDPSGRTSGLDFQAVPEAKVVKNRVHLDIRPSQTMAEEVARMRALGAQEIRVVREGSAWTVMGDVEGNEFCVLQGPAEGSKRDRPGLDSLVIDCADPFRVAAFWIEALGYREHERGESGIEIVGPEPGDPMLSFVTVPEPKTVKNRIHLDARPDTSMAQEVGRVKSLGATERGFIEVEGSFWTQMRDVEGNEFCVVRGPDDGWTPQTA